MKFYYRHKKATAYILGLLLLASFYHLTKGYSGNKEDISNKTSCYMDSRGIGKITHTDFPKLIYNGRI